MEEWGGERRDNISNAKKNENEHLINQALVQNIPLLIVWLLYEKFKESQLQGKLFFVDFMKAFRIVLRCRHRGVGHAKRVYRYIKKAKVSLSLYHTTNVVRV